MNKSRRKVISQLQSKTSETLSTIRFLLNKVEDVADEEEEAHYNTPDNLQSSDRYESAEDCIDKLYDAKDALSEAIDNLTTAESSLGDSLDS